MENDPTNPYEDEGDGVTLDDPALPPDSSWSEFFGGIWRRMTDPLPGATGS